MTSLLSAPSQIRILAQSAVGQSVTGTTSETTLATVTVPAGSMGANGRVRVTTLWSMTGSTNIKSLRVRFGGTSGTQYFARGEATAANAMQRHQCEIANRNATNSQVGGPGNFSGGFGTPGASAGVVTSAVDTTAAVDIVISGQLATSSETITLESYLVELISG